MFRLQSCDHCFPLRVTLLRNRRKHPLLFNVVVILQNRAFPPAKIAEQRKILNKGHLIQRVDQFLRRGFPTPDRLHHTVKLRKLLPVHIVDPRQTTALPLLFGTHLDRRCPRTGGIVL